MAQQCSASAAGNQEPEPAPAPAHYPPAPAPAPSPLAPAPAPSPPVDSEALKASLLEAQLQDLEDECKEIEKEELEILEAMDKLKIVFPSKELQIIAFVKAIEKAKQFFEFKDYLKDNVEYVMHDSDKLITFKRLVKEDKVHHRFDMLDFQDILDAVEERISDLHYERDEDHKSEQEKKNVQPCSKENKLLTLSAMAEKGVGEALNPFLNLVYNALEKSYVLHEDPQVVLDLLKKHNPIYYNHCFIVGLIKKCSEKTVFVRNIPSSYDQDRVKAIFSDCGEVESVILEHFNQWSQVADVTFKNSEGAKLAPILKRGWGCTVEPVHEFAERRSDVSTEYMEALNAYKTLRSDFSEKASGKLSRCRRKKLRRKRQQEAKAKATAATREQEEAGG